VIRHKLESWEIQVHSFSEIILATLTDLTIGVKENTPNYAYELQYVAHILNMFGFGVFNQ